MNNIFKKFNIANVNQSISMNGNKITINGKTIELPDGNVSIINNKIFVNGKEFNTDDTDLKNSCGVINVIIEGNTEQIQCSGNVEVNGNVSKSIDCGGSINIIGNITGDIDAGGSVSIR